MPGPWPAGVPVELALILAAGGGATGRWWAPDPVVQLWPAPGRRWWMLAHDPKTGQTFFNDPPNAVEVVLLGAELTLARGCGWRLPACGWECCDWTPEPWREAETMPFDVRRR